jgi:hypothetical protein
MKKNIAYILAMLILLGIAGAKGNNPSLLAEGLKNKNNQNMDYVILLDKTIKSTGDIDPLVKKKVLVEINAVLDTSIAQRSAIDFPDAGKYPAGIDPKSIPAGTEREAYIKAVQDNNRRNSETWFHQALMDLRRKLLE